MESSNIDDLLTGQSFSSDDSAGSPNSVSDEYYEESPKGIEVADETPHTREEVDFDSPGHETEEKAQEASAEAEDEYGNEKAAPKTYTEQEVNERINAAVRDRLARLEKRQAAPVEQPTKPTEPQFEYNPDSSEPWQQQLEKFVEQTMHKVSNRRVQEEQHQREIAAQQEFEGKFHSGMSKFADFTDVVGAQPVTDAMVMAIRGLPDPAAFLYAASKRASDELVRISKIGDPNTQMMEMGRLEARMKAPRTQTAAPRPLERTKPDGKFSHKSDREMTGDEMLIQADKERLQKFQSTGRRR